ncbi:MAG: hypothetical protein L0331_26355 [Chloroflexi bacterium]|nr:hypothetical protein [Chloroflexota bacterium]
MKAHRQATLLLIVLILAACQAGQPDLPTPAAAVPTALPAAARPLEPLPLTWTPGAVPAPTQPAWTGLPSQTPRPEDTPWPTRTPPPATGTNTPTPPATALPGFTPPPTPAAGPNLLPNPSFEEGWYNVNNIPELQVANSWILEWDEGDNPLDPDPWNAFVRPESRILSGDFLPPAEHELFIWDGEYTVKIFKGTGAVSYRLLTDVTLEPGRYLFEINFFPDLVVGYTPGGNKIWAPDPLSGEVQFIVNGTAGNWIYPRFGQKNTLVHLFEVPARQSVRLGAAFRGRWAILNNGWFIDDWSLRQLEPGGS